MNPPLLIEIGCEEIPARAVPGAAADLAGRLASILDQAGLAHGAAVPWGGTRRLAVRIEEVEGRQSDREEEVLGPPAAAAFGADGSLTSAALGFARKQRVDPGELKRVRTGKGAYAGFRRKVSGRTVGELLAMALPAAVSGMSFPKTMRWGTGIHRWVRPVHWLLALHGDRLLPLELFGVRASQSSQGHRFLEPGPVLIPHADRYLERLRSAFVIADPEERRVRLVECLRVEAAALGGEWVEDDELLREVVNLVEWPGVTAGRFDGLFLDLPREILVTTLRHHQKSFSIQSRGKLLPVFLSVTNTDRDPAGHIRRGHEWVVWGRLEDARFFWNEEGKRPLESRLPELDAVVFHKAVGSYRVKVDKVREFSEALASKLDRPPAELRIAARAAILAKADLVTGLVGEFPELQGIVGGLMLEREGEDAALARAVYEHYQPVDAEDPIPVTDLGRVVSVADKLSTVVSLLRAGEEPTGSKDPHGLRRGMNGIFRIVEESEWPVSLRDLSVLSGQDSPTWGFMMERFPNYLRERGYAQNEVNAVLRPGTSDTESTTWPLYDIVARLDAIKSVRGRADFEHLVDLTKRVDNILIKGSQKRLVAAELVRSLAGYVERETAAVRLAELLGEYGPAMQRDSAQRRYREIVETIALLIEPVDRFFEEVLVLDPTSPEATHHRCELLTHLKSLLTRYFDIRELAGQADRRPS